MPLQVTFQGACWSVGLQRAEPHSPTPLDGSCRIRVKPCRSYLAPLSSFPVVEKSFLSLNLTQTTRIICLNHNVNISLKATLPQSPKPKM